MYTVNTCFTPSHALLSCAIAGFPLPDGVGTNGAFAEGPESPYMFCHTLLFKCALKVTKA